MPGVPFGQGNDLSRTQYVEKMKKVDMATQVEDSQKMTDTGAQTVEVTDAVMQTATKSYSVDPNEPLVYHDFDYVGY